MQAYALPGIKKIRKEKKFTRGIEITSGVGWEMGEKL
jgi:hypothetical protein